MASESASGSATTGAQQNQNPDAGGKRTDAAESDGQVFMYNPDYLREQFAGLVIQRGLPFKHFDNRTDNERVFLGHYAKNSDNTHAHIRHIFLDGYGVLDVRTVIFKYMNPRVEESSLETLSMDELITQLRQMCEDAENRASNAQEEARQKMKEVLEAVVQQIYRTNN
ncbi:hypothetical protein Tco_0134809 [Tanacetum coccineum]